MSPKTLILNDDGWSSYMRYPAPMSPDDVVRATVGRVAGTAVGVYQFCALGGHAVNYASSFLPRVGEAIDRPDTMHVWRMLETLRHLESLGTDPLRVVSEACRQAGIACQFSLRMNDAHHTYRKADGGWYFPELRSPWIEQHPELQLHSGQLDYAHSQVREYRLRQIAEVLDGYTIGGIDLDFTRFRPWFAAGQEEAGRPLITGLIRELRETTRAKGKTLSARFEYDQQVCLASGLDVAAWLAERLLDQVTLGGIGDHTPDAPAGWWIERAHASACIVCPGMEGQLHWLPSCGGGGTGLRAGNGVEDGFGPPSMETIRAIAARHYLDGADGISLFNFTCAGGPFDRRAFTELADPAALRFGDKQYVAAVWPWDAQIFGAEWESRFRMPPGADEAALELVVADDLSEAARRGLQPTVSLTLDLKGINRLGDVEVSVNGAVAEWDGYQYNHYDHGCWNDVVRFRVEAAAVRQGENRIALRRLRDNAGVAGAVEVRKCVLEVADAQGIAVGALCP